MSIMLRKAVLSLLAGAALLSLVSCAQFADFDSTPGQPAAVSLSVCPPVVEEGATRCNSQILIRDDHGLTAAGNQPYGYTPAQIRHAYGLDKVRANGAGQTIAIVTFYDAPTIASDLATFKKQFGIAGCSLTKVNQSGGSSFPAANPASAMEASIDVEWVCALAPGANILLVEAKDNWSTNILGAVDYAARHAQIVVTSLSAPEFSSETFFDSHFNVPGVTFIAASGDQGNRASWPAAAPSVIGVGGTTLRLDKVGNLMGSETAWSGSSGGISAYEPSPAYQTSFPIPSAKGKRSVPDVSFLGDPQTGVAIYDSTPIQGQSGWLQAGGTSLSAMLMAGFVAVMNQAGHGLATPGQIYAAAKTNYAGNFRDIVSGANGGCGSLCTAGPGYDFITGLGSPHG